MHEAYFFLLLIPSHCDTQIIGVMTLKIQPSDLHHLGSVVKLAYTLHHIVLYIILHMYWYFFLYENIIIIIIIIIIISSFNQTREKLNKRQLEHRLSIHNKASR